MTGDSLLFNGLGWIWVEIRALVLFGRRTEDNEDCDAVGEREVFVQEVL